MLHMAWHGKITLPAPIAGYYQFSFTQIKWQYVMQVLFYEQVITGLMKHVMVGFTKVN